MVAGFTLFFFLSLIHCIVFYATRGKRTSEWVSLCFFFHHCCKVLTADEREIPMCMRIWGMLQWSEYEQARAHTLCVYLYLYATIIPKYIIIIFYVPLSISFRLQAHSYCATHTHTLSLSLSCFLAYFFYEYINRTEIHWSQFVCGIPKWIWTKM